MRTSASLESTICICLFVIAIVAFLQCAAQNEVPRQREFKRSTNKPDKTSQKKTGTRQFLIGEDAPVWLAFYHGSNVKFRRYDLPGYSKSVVGKAVGHYLERKNNMKFTMGRDRRRSMYRGYGIEESNTEIRCSKTSGCNAEQQILTNGLKNVYITALVIFDVKTLPSLTSSNSLDEVAKRITYILAFWNSVNIKLNNFIKTTKVIIRIAGIILSEQPYSFDSWSGTTKWSYENEAFHRMQVELNGTNWRDQFPFNSYDFVAYMTSVGRGNDNSYLPQGISGWQPFCGNDDHRVGNIIIWDDFSFSGIDGAVQELLHVLGPNGRPRRVKLIPRMSWKAESNRNLDKCLIRQVSDVLPYAWCLIKPREYFPVGEPVRSILPGEMMTVKQYCATLGYEEIDGYSRFNPGCSKMECGYYERGARGYGMSTWSWVDMGRVLDGTSCASTDSMVCMDGRCVRNKWKKLY